MDEKGTKDTGDLGGGAEIDLGRRSHSERLLIAQRDLGTVLAGTASLKEAMDLSLEAALRLSGMSCGGIYLLDETGVLRLAACSGVSQRFAASASQYAPGTANWQLVMSGRPHHARWEDLNLAAIDCQEDETPAVASIIPVLHQGRVIACFNVASRRLEEASPSARTALEAIAAQIGNAIARLQAEERLRAANAATEERMIQLRAMATELTQAEQRERRRLAQALHDHLQQILVGARLKVGLIQRRAGSQESGTWLKQLDDLLNEAITECRLLTTELSPPVLYEAGLAVALEWLASQIEKKYGLVVEVQADPGIDPLEETTRVFLFQAVHELLFNVVKHAGADRAWVRADRTACGEVQIEVGDHGAGCDPARLKNHGGHGEGFGLFSICQRLELMGGRMEVESAPGKGTRVLIVVPARRIDS